MLGLYNTHGPKLYFPPSEKTQFGTKCGIRQQKRGKTVKVFPLSFVSELLFQEE